MIKDVLFRPRQEVQADDLNNIQAFARESLDHLGRDAITTQDRYSGFEVTSKNTTEVYVAPGRMIHDGAFHTSDDQIEKSLFSHLPLVAKKVVTVVCWPTTVNDTPEARQYLINVLTKETQPQTNDMRRIRFANVGLVPGTESSDPQPPVLAAQYLGIANIVLTPTGIESITMIAENRLPRLTDMDNRVVVVERFVQVAEPRLQTIGSDIAALNNRVRGAVDTRALIEIASDVARLKDVNGIPDTAASYAADMYLSTAESDTANLDYLAKVEEGIRFDDEAADETSISVFNPLDTAQVVQNGILLPAYTSLPRISVLDYAGELKISQYQSQAQTLVQKMMSRQRIRYGETFSVCTNNRAYWAQGEVDPVNAVFKLNGETFNILDKELLRYNHTWVRLQQFWTDTYEEPYWDVQTTTTTVNGQVIAQSMLNSQDGWLTGIKLGFTRLAGSGSVTLAICETYQGAPNPNKVVAQVTLPRGDLKLYPQDGLTLFPLPPTFLAAGNRYAMIVITSADHYVALASGGTYAQGTLFYSTDGNWFMGDLTKDLLFTAEFARFTNVRTVTELAPLSLSGGIAALDIMAGMVVPRSCQVFFEVQKSGGQWESIDSLTPAKLVGLPPLLQFRVIMIGTSDVAPGIKVSGSRVKLSRPRTTFKHISTARTLPAPTSTVKLRTRLENWTAAHHAHSARLLCGASFDVIETADVTDTIDTEDPKAIIREYTFNTAAPVSTFKIEQSGTTTTALDTYLVSSRVDIAF